MAEKLNNVKLINELFVGGKLTELRTLISATESEIKSFKKLLQKKSEEIAAAEIANE